MFYVNKTLAKLFESLLVFYSNVKKKCPNISGIRVV